MKKPRIMVLDISKDLPRVLETRSACPEYRSKLKRFQRTFKGKRVIVLGSSKTFEAPQRGADDIIVCINGSSHNGDKMGIDVPHVTFFVSYLTAQVNEQQKRTFEVLNGRSTRDLVFITGTLDFDQCVENLKQIDFSYETIDEVTLLELAATIGAVCGSELAFGKIDQRISSGMVAIALALLAGASEVVVAGFSFTKGHSYMDGATRRYHVAADIEFLSLCAQRKLPVSTTSPEVSQRCGLPLAPRETPKPKIDGSSSG